MMLDSPEAVFEALRENHDRPYGRHRTVVAEELVDASERFEDRGALVTALLELMTAYEYTGERRKSPVVFARILKLWEDQPQAFSEREAHQVYWRFKWVASALLQVPDMPLSALHRWADEMRDRYRAAGHGVQPVYAVRYEIAAHTGMGTDHAYDLWVTRPRTHLSDCEACEIRLRALHHVRRGDDERALSIWQPVLVGRLACADEPFLSHAHALLPLVRQGRADEARSSHLVGYRFSRGKSGMAEEIGLHLEFCVLTRNEGRALEILAENRGLFEGSGAPLAHLGFLTGAELLLASLVGAGHAGLAVAGPSGENWSAGSLLTCVRDEADALAASFDARNGTTAVGGTRLRRLAQQPLLAEPLALGIRAASAPAAQASVQAARPAAEDIPQDFITLVTRARELALLGHPDSTALWRRIADVISGPGHIHAGELGSEQLLHAELAEQRAFRAYECDRWSEGRTAMTEAADLFERAGQPGRAVTSRARAAWALGAQRTDDGADARSCWEELDAALRRADELLASGGIDPDRYVTVLQCRASAAHDDLIAALPDASPEVRKKFESSVAAFLERSTGYRLPVRMAAARQYAADAAAREGRFEAAIADLRTGLALVEEAGQPWRAPRLLALLGQTTLHQGRPQEAVTLVHQAMSEAARWADEGFPVGGCHAMLGMAFMHEGDATGAIRHLSEAADRFDRDGDDGRATEIRLQLADVLAGTGRQADAVAVLESVLAEDDADAMDERLRAQVTLNLGRGLRELGEHRAAAEEFLRLADTVAGWDDRDTHTLVASEAAVALAAAGRWDAARTAYDRAVASHRAAARPQAITKMMREFARLTMAAEESDSLKTALGHLDEADAVCADTPRDAHGFVHWYETGAIRYQRGRAYAGAERYQEAVAELERAISAYEAGGRPAEEPRAEAVRVAAMIEGNALGAVDAARTRLTATISRCEQAGLAEAASILTALHDQLGARRSG